eukprot:2660463-Amphidinium_carterae.1
MMPHVRDHLRGLRNVMNFRAILVSVPALIAHDIPPPPPPPPPKRPGILFAPRYRVASSSVLIETRHLTTDIRVNRITPVLLLLRSQAFKV